MKILVLSLLRLGDIILMVPAISGVKKKYPEADIDLMLNEQFSFVSDILPHIGKVHEFPRSTLQQNMGQYEVPLLEPFDHLTEFLDQIRSENYDLVINLTQTHLSGYLTSLIGAPRTEGLSFDRRDEAVLNSPWLRYLDGFSDRANKEGFHYADIYQFGIGNIQTEPIKLLKTTEGRKYAEKIVQPEHKTIAIQLATSDGKKDFDHFFLRDFIKLYLKRSLESKSSRVVLLGAPSEEEALINFKQSLPSVEDSITVAACTIPEVISVLDRVALLITGDTSISHLAASARCKILQFSFGSSDIYKTGPYKSGSYVVHSQIDCYPCRHSSDCSRPNFYCKQALMGSDAVILAQIAVGEATTESLSKDFYDNFRLFCASKVRGGSISYLEVGAELSLHSLKLLRKCSFKMALNNSDLKLIPEYSKESGLLMEGLISVGIVGSEIGSILNTLEYHIESDERTVNRLNFLLDRAVKSSRRAEFLEEFEMVLLEGFAKSKLLLFFKEQLEELDIVNLASNREFIVLRTAQNWIDRICRINGIEKRLIRSIKNRITEEKWDRRSWNRGLQEL